MTRIVKAVQEPKKKYQDLNNSDESSGTMEVTPKQTSQQFMFKSERKEPIQQAK